MRGKEITVMLNFDTIRSTPMQQVPYRYAVIENLVPKEASLQLEATFPQKQFRLSTGEGYSYLWGQLLANSENISSIYKFNDRWRQRINEGRLTSDLGNLSSTWSQLIQELWSPAYREALEKMSGLELRNCPMVIGFRRYNSGHCQRPHTDEPTKVLTHLLFFNQQWSKDWGGCLRILFDSQRESTYKDIFPLSESSVAIARSENSWHMVTPVTSPASVCRLALRVAFFKNLT